MTDRIHDSLDCELPREVLSPGEAIRLEDLERTIEAVAQRVRAQMVPDLSARVMAALPQPSAAAPRETIVELLRGFAQRLWTPRRITFQMRPAYGLGFAMAALTVLSLGPVSAPHPTTDLLIANAAPEPAPSMYVQFRLDAPGAARVELAGSFTGWDPTHALRETSPGVWAVAVPIEAGVHDYLFVVDGREWVPDPAAYQVQDDFGGVNSRLLVSLPHART